MHAARCTRAASRLGERRVDDWWDAQHRRILWKAWKPAWKASNALRSLELKRPEKALLFWAWRVGGTSHASSAPVSALLFADTSAGSGGLICPTQQLWCVAAALGSVLGGLKGILRPFERYKGSPEQSRCKCAWRQKSIPWSILHLLWSTEAFSALFRVITELPEHGLTPEASLSKKSNTWLSALLRTGQSLVE